MPDHWFPGDPWSFDSIKSEPMKVRERQLRFKVTEESTEQEKATIKPWGRYRRKAYVGIDIGKRTDPTAIALLEPFEPTEQRRDNLDVYDVSLIRRIPLDTPYPKVAKGMAKLDKELRKTKEFDYIYYIVDSGGVGESVTDMVVDLLPNADIKRCYLTGGMHPSINDETQTFSLPKQQMASTMIMLFESDRIQVSGVGDEYLEELEALRDELYNYELRISPTKVDMYGAFKFGKHDDLATALGLASWLAEWMEGRGEVKIW